MIASAHRHRGSKSITGKGRMWTTMAYHFQGAALLCTYTDKFSSSSSITSSTASITHARPQIPTSSGARVPLLTFGTKQFVSTTPPAILTDNPRRLSATVSPALICHGSRRKATTATAPGEDERNDLRRTVVQLLLWGAEAVYILWLFLLPYAPVRILPH